MFFGRIYQWGKPFKPSWRSYAVYAGVVALILLAIEFGVLNVMPDNAVGGVLLIVPGFYGLVAVVFFVNDALLAAWSRFGGRFWGRSKGGSRRRRRRTPAARGQRPSQNA